MAQDKRPFVIAIDWGTSNLRLWVLSHQGDILAHKTSDQGMSQLCQADYPVVFEGLIADLSLPDKLPVLICGMAGAASGWQEAGYAPVPIHLSELASHVTKIEGQARDVRIIKGLSYQDQAMADVMRGEETLLYGLSLKGIAAELICLPGTHAKWVHMQEGQVTHFATTMTGELFTLLSTQSVLSSALGNITSDDDHKKAFYKGLNDIAEQPDSLTKLLFSVRAKGLLSKGSLQASTAYLSGLLIGSEIISNKATKQSVALVSSGKMANLYKDAFAHFKIATHLIDAQEVAIAGLHKMASAIWGVDDE